MKKNRENSLQEVLDHVCKITGSLAAGVVEEKLDREETTDILACYSGMFAEVVTAALVRGLPVGCEDLLPEKIEDAIQIFRVALIGNTRGVLEYNGIPDPWEESPNQEIYNEILQEMKNEQKNQQ